MPEHHPPLAFPGSSHQILRQAYLEIYHRLPKSDIVLSISSNNTLRQIQSQPRASASSALHDIPSDSKFLTVPPRARPPVMAAMTAVATTAMPSYPGASSDGYPPEFDQPTMEYMPRNHWAAGNTSMVRTPRPGFETTSHRRMVRDPAYPAYPVTLNRPRKLSMATSSTATPVSSPRDSFEFRSRSSSWSSQTSFQSFDSPGAFSAWRPEYGSPRPSPIRTDFMPVQRPPGELFAALPGEVLDLILEKLRDYHLSWRSDSCATCAMRDMCSIASASRRWHAYATRAL